MLSNLRRSDKARRAALNINSQSSYVEVGSERDVLFAQAREDVKNVMSITRIHACTCHEMSAEWQPSCHHVVSGKERTRKRVRAVC